MDEITVDELWEYFSKHRKELENNFHLVASNEAYGVEIYLTEEHGFPAFSIEVDGEVICSIESYSKLDAEKTYDGILTRYIYPDEPEEENFEAADPDEVDGDCGRVEEIICAVDDLLYVLLEADPGVMGLEKENMEEIASILEEHLYENFGLRVRHPMEIDGEIVQYPCGDPTGEEDLPDGDISADH